MATKDEKPGLLSKVAMFVRNPTKDWSELDQPEQPQESAYDKQALKAMIERKRQNDFVRKREFDQLRKLRNRDPVAMANLARPSFFQTSLPTDPDGRAGTLKKIDEIEAQMSKQWWKGKQEGDTTRASALPVSAPPSEPDTEDMEAHSQMPTQGPVLGPESFEATEAIGLRRNTGHAPMEFPATQLGSPMGEMAAASAAYPGADAEHAYAGSDLGFSTSELFAIDVDDMETDPELEEAAIRFANGDDAGAERGLLEALRGDALQPEVALSWAAALLDLYRATNNRVQFDGAVVEFGMRFDKITPQWASLADSMSAGYVAPASPSVVGAAGDMAWDCPAELNLAAMESLRDALSSQPPPWHVGWTRLESVAEDAVPLMGGLFSSLCDEPVTFRFSGVEHLVERLRAMTPSGNRSVAQPRWQVRLDALRAMNMQDEFELAALDYCVTFEVSPPAWTDARCHFENAAHGLGHEHHTHTDPGGPATVPMGFDSGASQVLELQGEVLGDASQALARLNEGGPRSGPIVVSCQGLVRVDFSAAGSILNWVATRQAEGGRVQFRHVHRLVAAFFNVIGINEHAKVVPRPI